MWEINMYLYISSFLGYTLKNSGRICKKQTKWFSLWEERWILHPEQVIETK